MNHDHTQKQNSIIGNHGTQYSNLLEQAARYSSDYINTICQKPAFPDEKAIQALDIFQEELPANKTDASAVIKLLHERGAPATTAEIGGRFFGFVNGGLLPVAHAAEWLADTWNQNAALYVMSPIAAKLEEICEQWMVQLLGLPTETAMGLVTGSSNALICALAAARNELLRRQGYDLSRQGLRNAPPLRIVLGAEAHSSVRAALCVLGIGADEIETVPTDDFGRMRPDHLPRLDSHTLLILQAGNVNGGAFDPIDTLCDAARAAGTWVHIDGAFGLWAAASHKYRHLVNGLEKADSWSLDAHKTLNAGYDCGIVLCRRRDVLARALQASGTYIAYSDHRDGMLYTTEMSRRARSIVLWAVLKHLGSKGVERLVDTLCAHAEYFSSLLQLAGFTLAAPVCFNQFMVKADTPKETENVLAAVQSEGICWCGGSRWKKEPVIRISVCSHKTTMRDINESAAALSAAWRYIKNERNE